MQTDASTRRASRSTFTLGALALAAALCTSGLLALEHLTGLSLPGCGLDSPCERALHGPYGTLPWIGWPLAFAGFAYDAGLLAAWLVAGELGRLRWLVRLGGVASLALAALALRLGEPCAYCLATHAANLAFVVISERTRSPGRRPRAELAFVAAALVVSAGLALAWSQVEPALRAPALPLEGAGRPLFTGRHRRGPERAAVRVVLFTDYQCADCAAVEAEAWTLVEERRDVSLSIKHFPLSKDCNRRARELGRDPHPNACWAARAAEAAGMLAGAEAFWRMHRWLFERGGAFTAAELRAGLASLGLDARHFLPLMNGSETRALVEADVEEGIALGIRSTPLVYLDGIELREWRPAGALRAAVEERAARAQGERGPELDQPPLAFEKALTDWRLEPRLALPSRAADAGDPARGIVVWGDYLDEKTRALDRRLRALLAQRPGVVYSYRHFPLDPACAPGVPARNPGACLAARAAEAARALWGVDGASRLHARLMSAPAPLDETRLAAVADELGLDSAALLARTAGAETAEAVRADVTAARRIGVHEVPFLAIAGRRVPRWELEGEELLEAILLEAFGER